MHVIHIDVWVCKYKYTIVLSVLLMKLLHYNGDHYTFNELYSIGNYTKYRV